MSAKPETKSPKDGKAGKDPKAAAAKDAPEEHKGPDEAELRQMSLVASTFANVELQSTKNTLAQYVTLYNSSREDLAKLTQELQERDRDAMTVVQFLRDDLEKRQDQIKTLKKKAAEDLQALEAKSQEEKQDLMDAIRGRDDTIAGLRGTIGGLEADLDALHAFRRERDNMHSELVRLNEQHMVSVEHYEAELSNQRFLSLEEKVRLKAEERMMEERFDAEVNGRAMKLLDSKTREIHAENFMLLKDKASLERELARAMESYQKASEKANEQRRECELTALADSEHVRRAVGKSREVKELQARCTEMESNLAHTIRDHEATAAGKTKSYERAVAVLTKERDDAIKVAELIQRDFQKMRQLTRTVVKQRTELETFFMEALDYVRMEIDRERKTAAIAAQSTPPPRITAGPSHHASGTGLPNVPMAVAARAKPPATSTADRVQQAAESQQNFEFFAQGSRFEALGGQRGSAEPMAQSASRSTSTLPRIGKPPGPPPSGGPSVPQPPSAPSRASATTVSPVAGDITETHIDPADIVPGRVDISELSWGDKERVLRILFAKINATNQQRQPPKRLTQSHPAIEMSSTRDSVFMTQQR
jgi:hypothetical protein